MRRGFLLGPKLAEARAAGRSKQDAAFFERNLRTQLSVWGTSAVGGSEIEDYANRQWAGLMSGYYRPRREPGTFCCNLCLRAGRACATCHCLWTQQGRGGRLWACLPVLVDILPRRQLLRQALQGFQKPAAAEQGVKTHRGTCGMR